MSQLTTLPEALAAVALARAEAEALLAAGKPDEVQRRFLAQKGRFRELQGLLGQLPADAKKEFGKAFNDARRAVEEAHATALAAAPKPTVAAGFDFLPGVAAAAGALHPLQQTMDEVADILGRLGFAMADGPEVEDPFHNFVALNIPEEHPARDPRDNFYLPSGLLRSQTSTVQIRVMETRRPPIRIFSMGRVYRPDELDATHAPMFHQVEGLLVDEGIGLADLKSVLRMFCASYLGEAVRIRFRPSFFPFTEPSIEVDMSWGAANDRWVEMGGAGMVDPNVFAAVGIDPERYTGFAFGLGIERLTMRRHGIDHMRHLCENDVRVLRQFG